MYVPREPADAVLDQQDWNEDVADELNEMREAAEEEFQKRMEEYSTMMRLWNEQKKRKVNKRFAQFLFPTKEIPVLVLRGQI